MTICQPNQGRLDHIALPNKVSTSSTQMGYSRISILFSPYPLNALEPHTGHQLMPWFKRYVFAKEGRNLPGMESWPPPSKLL